MRCRFWLVDLNDGVCEGKLCVRLWGIEENNRRVIVVATQIRPYFYLLTSVEAESAAKRLESERERFSDITGISIEERKLLGKESSLKES